MRGIFIIPTGLGCEIGGHAGDATPFVKLIAATCDELIVNPNAVNASDINEMPSNCLYVEGSIIDRFLNGYCFLNKVRSNKILLAVNTPVHVDTINSVNAARAVLGADITIVELEKPLTMISKIVDGIATGEVDGHEELARQLLHYHYDALAVQSPIEVDKQVADDYIAGKIKVNPWGGVEAKASKLIADRINKPVAHAPIMNVVETVTKVVDPRMAAEFVSVSFLYCILKGLHKAPRPDIEKGFTFESIDFLITPAGCWSTPHQRCLEKDIPIIGVLENDVGFIDVFHEEIKNYTAKTYLEAAGMLLAMKEGIALNSLRRPLEQVEIAKIWRKEDGGEEDRN